MGSARGLCWTVAVVAAACGDGSGPDGQELVAVTVIPGDTTLLSGQSVLFHAAVRTASGATVDTPVTWVSSDTLFATVHPSTGLVRAQRPGQAIIRAFVGAVGGSSKVGVMALRFAEIASGGAHSCALTTEGMAFCWGDNIRGQLGDGSRTGRPYPVAVRGGFRFTAITTGGGQSCAIDQANAAYCWGTNISGQLGDGSTTDRAEPVPVLGGHQFIILDTGPGQTCGITVSGTTLCWGSGHRGSLGTGDTLDRYEPAVVAGNLPFRSISAGGTSCAVTINDRAYCWGRNTHGALGDGTTTDRSVPTPVPNVLFQTVDAGAGHTCAVALNGIVFCWGRNSQGQIGDGSTTDRFQPVRILGSTAFSTVGVGTSHSCGKTMDGTAVCWGRNFSGQLGLPWDSLLLSTEPVTVSGGFAFASIHIGGSHTCGLADDSLAYCWGTNAYGRLGIGAPSFGSYLPVRVFGQQ